MLTLLLLDTPIGVGINFTVAALRQGQGEEMGVAP
jgi:hypothetical protein